MKKEELIQKLGDIEWEDFEVKTTQKTTQKIILLLKENPKSTRKEISKILNMSEDGVKWNLDKLKKEKKIKRIGPDKGGSWKVLK